MRNAFSSANTLPQKNRNRPLRLFRFLLCNEASDCGSLAGQCLKETDDVHNCQHAVFVHICRIELLRRELSAFQIILADVAQQQDRILNG